MRYILQVPGKSLYLKGDVLTPLLADADSFEDPRTATSHVALWRGQFPLNVVKERFAIEDQVREFIRQYHDEPDRGEKAAVAAMNVIKFHSNMDIAALHARTTRCLQVIQAFQGLIERMGIKSDDSQGDAEAEVPRLG